ncbi:MULTISPECIES: HK97 family phage prohead protease [unclassified Streptococcus]|uniref:HK97 family phage prohead protease n=1 Tax=unclassified Streptococcus TaxID=2608887 RepID=UPI00211ACA5E|nr:MULTISPECIES: HK97 family phage prohead protease [unclassified Streptococcus]MCQ9211651.1 HK97 family phage prohead protease [Streptococcus sp. B01]MCQ9213168.1 HK97 family phage prohead protease [Streptococcus sp. O1]MCQ9215043.1 HK97 family phage prohead protease [Streptococcus sp. O1]MCQ9215090.1 HK97 family phage prohead protease [Streptococcus sp. O1]
MKHQKRECYRSADFQIREDSDTTEKVLSGYFIKFEEETEIFPGYFEVIDKRSLDDVLEKSDIRALFNHDTSLVLGRTGNGTFIPEVDEIGLRGDIVINQDDPAAIGAYARVKRGDVVGCSFGFIPTKIDTQQREDGSVIDRILKMELLEVSPCTFPAYPQTEIAARNKDYEASKMELLNRRKIELKEKYQL